MYCSCVIQKRQKYQMVTSFHCLCVECISRRLVETSLCLNVYFSVQLNCLSKPRSVTLLMLVSVCCFFVYTGSACTSALIWQDGISETTRWWLGLGDCCRFLLHSVLVLRITAGGGSLVCRMAGCFWRRERQDCLGWIASKWNRIACQ